MELGPETGVLQVLRIPIVLVALLLGASELLGARGGDEHLYTTATLEARVHASRHLREHERAPIDVEIRNRGPEACDVVVALSPEYVDSFANVAMVPEPDQSWTVRLEDVAPGEERLVAVELEAITPGPHHGELRIRGGGEELAIPMHTFVDP